MSLFLAVLDGGPDGFQTSFRLSESNVSRGALMVLMSGSVGLLIPLGASKLFVEVGFILLTLTWRIFFG